MERFLIFSELILDCKEKELVDCGKILFVNPQNIIVIDEHEQNKDVMLIHFTQGQYVFVWKKEVENYRKDGRI